MFTNQMIYANMIFRERRIKQNEVASYEDKVLLVTSKDIYLFIKEIAKFRTNVFTVLKKLKILEKETSISQIV